MFFEEMDLYRTLDLTSSPTDSYNFKQTINCPAPRANMNEPSTVSRGLTGVIIALWRTLVQQWRSYENFSFIVT